MRLATLPGTVLAAGLAAASPAGAAERIVDLPTRPGVTQRLLVVAPEDAPRATLILLPGGHGGLQLGPDGAFGWGKGNFLCRSRGLFAEQGFLVALVDAPSDRQAAPWLDGFPGTQFADTQRLMGALRPVAQRELLAFQGGEDVGDPCQARGHHGFAGIEREVVVAVGSWIVSGRAGAASR
jgi:hypothetical protein